MPDDVWASIERQQTDTGASVSEIVRRALVAYFDGKANGNGRPKTKAVTKRVPRPVTKAVTKRPPAKRPSKAVAKA
jgi:hypothetical protein